MSSFIRKFYKSGLVWNLYKKSILRDLCIPCYHSVTDNSQAHIRNLFPIINVDKFEKDIDFLGKNFDFISPVEVLESMDNNIMPKNKCILTFDDGYKECYDIIYPILKRKGIPAIFFLVKDFVDNKNLGHFNKISLILENLNTECSKTISKNILIDNSLYSGNLILDIKKLGIHNSEIINLLGEELNIDFKTYLDEVKPYLNSDQIMEMHSKGFGIGAHSVNHYRFTELNIDEQRLQLKESIDYIQLLTNEPTRFFAFPYSSYGFKSELYKEFSDIVYFDTYKGFQRSNSKIVQRFVTDSFDNLDSKLVEMKLKKLSYNIRLKKLPKPSLLNLL